MAEDDMSFTLFDLSINYFYVFGLKSLYFFLTCLSLK